MKKKLVTIGNSVGLIIDKSLRHTLGIKPTTLVRVMTDGNRLIVEPCGDRAVAVVDARAVAISQLVQARAVATALLHRWGPPNQDFERLTLGWPSPRLRM